METEEKKTKSKTKQADLFDPKTLELMLSFFAKAKMPTKNVDSEEPKTKIESSPSKEAEKAKKKEKAEKKKQKKEKKKAKKDKKNEEKKDLKEANLKEKKSSKLKVEIYPSGGQSRPKQGKWQNQKTFLNRFSKQTQKTSQTKRSRK